MINHVDGRLDVGRGVVGALGILLDLGTPFLRGVRSRFGLAEEETERAHPGDDRVPEPDWQWTHGIEIDAPAERVWPWVVQIGQDKAGFYSYEWLENLVGCEIRNANAVRPEWQNLKVGDSFRLHPRAAPLRVSDVLPGRWFVVTGELDPRTGGPPHADRPERAVRVSWLFLVEPLGDARCRFISRFRIAHGKDLRARWMYGPWLGESAGFVMDRAMLRGVKSRAERGPGARAA